MIRLGHENVNVNADCINSNCFFLFVWEMEDAYDHMCYNYQDVV
jgi:hypothetical protein